MPFGQSRNNTQPFPLLPVGMTASANGWLAEVGAEVAAPWDVACGSAGLGIRMGVHVGAAIASVVPIPVVAKA